MNRVILAILIVSSQILPASAESTLKKFDKPHEYKISEATRSIVFGKACQMTIDGNSARFIRKTAGEMVVSYEENIRSKDAKILGNIVANNAIKRCGLITFN